jgi:hypothetical protein
MGEKKSKALANKLIDDLLNDDVTHKSEEHVEEPPKRKVQPSRVEKHSIPEESLVLDQPDEGSRTVKTPTEHVAHEKTVRLQDQKQNRPKKDEHTARTTVGRVAPFRSSGGVNSSTEVALAQSENLRIAQQRMFELEQEIERLRLQNEELASAAETLRRVGDEMSSENQRLKGIAAEIKGEAQSEKELLLESKESIQRELESIKTKNEELEVRVSTNVQKIRVRERELENRLELVKMEGAALLRSKDEMLLDLKRQVDQLNLELNNYRTKNQELNRHMNEKQEILRRTVKTLRLALSMLEGDAAAIEQQKKAK